MLGRLSLIKRYADVLPKELITYSVLDAIVSSLFWVVQAPYLKCLGFTAIEYGLLGSVYAASVVCATLVVGWLTDRFRAKYLMITSLIIRSVSLMLYLPGAKLLIYVAAVINGVSAPISMIPTDVLISRLVEERRLEYGYSLIHALFLLGNSVGSYTGWVPELVSRLGILDIVTSYRYVIATSSISLPFLALLLVKIKEPNPQPITSRTRNSLNGSLPRDVLLVVAKLCLAEVLIGLGASVSIRNISYYFILKYGVKSGELGTIYGIESLLMAILMIYLPSVSERIGSPLRTYCLVAMTSVPLLLGMTLVNSYVIASALFICRSVLMNAASPLFTAFEMRIIPPQHRGKASSMIRLADSVASIFGRGFGGYLMSLDLELPLRVTALLYATSLTYLLLTFRGSRDVRP